MSASTWFIIAIVGFSLAGIALITAIFMFIKMDIPSIVGDLSGKTVAKEIKAMREMNSATGNKIHRSSRVNLERGMLTDKVDIDMPEKAPMGAAHASKRLDNTTGSMGKQSENIPVMVKKEKETFSTQVPTTESFSDNATEVLIDDNATEVLTEVLVEENATEVLTEEGATEVLVEESATEVLSEEPRNEKVVEMAEGTTVLEQEDEEMTVYKVNSAFKIKRKMIEIHTNEEIQ